MIKFLNTRALLFICLVLSATIFASCDKDDDIIAGGQVQLLSFGPTGAMHGDTLHIIGNNLNKVTAVDLTGASVAQTAFIEQTAERILLIIPQETVRGSIMLKSPGGDIVSKSQLNLEVMPQITSLTAQARPGENITITGDLLNWVTRVTFANDKIVDSFVSQSINQLVVTIPVDAQTGPIIISYGGTVPLESESDDTVKVILPEVTSLSPNPVLHAANLTIAGTNLDLARSIKFNGVSTPVTAFVSQTATQIVVKVPAGATKGKIALVAPSGVTTQSAAELDVTLPSITGIAPNPVKPEDNITITGTNLNLVSGISFTGITAAVTAFVSQSPTQIVAKVPAGSLKGKLVFSVLNSSLTVESSQVLDLIGGLPDLAPFTFAIYTDGLQNTFQDWSYTDTHDFNSTANVRQGTKSVKAIYNTGNGYQGITFHAGTPASTAGFTKLEFSVFGETGTGGKKLNVVINGNYGGPTQVTIVEGEWSTFSLSLSSIGSPATLSEIVLQSAGFGGVLHIDHVGLR